MLYNYFLYFLYLDVMGYSLDLLKFSLCLSLVTKGLPSTTSGKVLMCTWSRFNIKTAFPGMEISIIKIRRRDTVLSLPWEYLYC